ncbi:MAG TPA: tetratricopeptide repeat protein, partial [Gemmatimonadaceae bacterium]
GSNALPVSAQTLAILPFVNNNPESTGDYLVLGFTDAVGSRLSAASGLELAGLFSASALQRQGLTPRAVGERLRTMYVLEGSVRTVSERLHTSVRLTRVADGSLLWSREFSAPSSDVVALEQEVADSIGKALQVQPADSDAAAAPTAIRAEAYDLYLKGRYAWEQRTRSKMEEALAYYRGAVARDPQFALAYSSLAEAYVNMLNFGHVPTREALAIAEVASAKAIALDTSLAEGYSTRGQVLASRGDYAAAESAFRHAIEVRPGAPWAHHYYALLLAMEGRFAEAERETRRTLAIDPLSVPANATLGILMAQQGRLDNARTQLERTLQLSPNFVVTLYYLGSVEAAGGRYEQARAHLEQALATAPNFPGVRGALAYTFSKSGRDSDARRLLRESRERVAGQASMSDERTRLNHALDMALIGNADSAFAMMRTAQWDIPTLFDLRADPLLRRVRADPRYSKLAGALRIKS